MSLVSPSIPSPSENDSSLGKLPDSRLWPALSRKRISRQPPKGFDVAGERLRGLIARRRAGKSQRQEAEQIVERAATLADLSERDLNERIEAIRNRVQLARHDRQTVHEAFAVSHEAIRRETGLSLYVEQVMGAMAMVNGCCAEMATGEGKTITAVMVASLEGWTGRGVHVITVNDYLAGRDAQITQGAYRRLGLKVGVIQDQSDTRERRKAYAASVTYAADKQVIFDFLRDRLISPLQPRMVNHLLDQFSSMDPSAARHGTSAQDMPNAQTEQGGENWSRLVVQRGLHAAIVDEADSVLIDEAVTPAIIGQDQPAEATEARNTHFHIAAQIATGLTEDEDYIADTRLHRVLMTDKGRERVAEQAKSLPPFWAGRRRREELVIQALGAVALYKRGQDYIVKDKKIIIVDRSTGRMLEGRQWQLGVHQAVEAKEDATISDERRTTARISYQKFFQRYTHLCGMTGTAWEVAPELWRDYRLPVMQIPTHRPVIRVRPPDKVFSAEQAKFDAVADRVQELHKRGQPVLVGTWSVVSSEKLGQVLQDRGVPCRILNAEREAEEADIIAEAGHVGAVTVATNMAGRGTDIILQDRARELGGLVVIATERHEEARVDRQLFGRSGRQGDPGRSEVYVSLEDSLVGDHGLWGLVPLSRGMRGPMRKPLTDGLWWMAQWAASRKAAVMRAEAAKHDAWLDMAMHHQTR